uniref:Receptor-like protein kinase At5g39030 family n=1 Tax=Cajanus cajan TaxID=3821 RepID=A0A151TYQ9_CAJCA|nr:putative receptor-like protein kinase At5g39030 family [Cajanus cajan]
MIVFPSFYRCAQTMVGIVVIIFVLFQQTSTCSAKHDPSCVPSSCGKISNITYPFRLKGDPRGCGLRKYELDCVNNVTVFTLFLGKYHVQDINYARYEIRLIDAGVVEDTACSIPRYFLNRRSLNFFDGDDRLTAGENISGTVFLNCTNPVTDDPRYVDVNVGGCDSGGHIYAVLNRNQEFTLMDIKGGCRVKVATFANWTSEKNVSYGDIREWLHNGFWLSWLSPVTCRDNCGRASSCSLNETTEQVQCDEVFVPCYIFEDKLVNNSITNSRIYKSFSGTKVPRLVKRITFRTKLTAWEANEDLIGQYVLPIFLVARCLFGVSLLLMLYIYMWRRRHVSMYENIEMFLLDNNLNPIRYEYKEIKKMTEGFKVILGQGGFGFVYKGKLQSGSHVAIKMLNKSETNGQDFISEVATIGRIHHMNVVRLIGYCVEGKKRALVYEYMPNGSLDKYIFSKEGSVPLSYKKTYEISLGVAHGIAYFHQGCDVQILHFDIKPHNILLDDNLIPKVSDFGLAKLYHMKDRSIVLTGARGTLGYMAPELFYQNIGKISYKADVYSFGMLLMEMGSRRRNSNPHADHSSQHYFPFWIYDQFKEENDIDMEDASEEDKILVKKMFIVALWCIQLKPSDRPSMKKVVEMLEGKFESLEMPPKPIFYPHEDFGHDSGIISDQTSWSGSTSYNNNLSKIEYGEQ